ncbi:MAG: cysteine desulfurase [Nitrososphaerota archaeon]|nr:cysteine desulfurase [Nitrososphaerota archaeon]
MSGGSRDLSKLRSDFPILSKVRQRDGKPLIYLDNAATSLKPRQVVAAIKSYYENYCANVHRGVYSLSQEATNLYEDSRAEVARFIGCDSSELVFTKNTTDGINIVAHGLSWNTGDEVVLSVMEHHSNIVPWQIVAKRFGVKLRYIGITDSGELDLEELERVVTSRTRVVAICHVSNVLGTINDVKRIKKIAHENGALMLVDAAQSVPHIPVNVKDLECDILAFSGHKALGPTGIGCLYVRKGVEEEIDPPFGGGEMINNVELSGYTLNDMPWRLEAGTPNIAGAIGLGAAISYLRKVGMDAIMEHERGLTDMALKLLGEVDRVEIYGPKDPSRSCGIVAFNLRGVTGDLVAALLDEFENVAVRSGFHCAQPLHMRLGIKGSVRISFYLYNTVEELMIFQKALERISREFGAGGSRTD